MIKEKIVLFLLSMCIIIELFIFINGVPYEKNNFEILNKNLEIRCYLYNPFSDNCLIYSSIVRTIENIYDMSNFNVTNMEFMNSTTIQNVTYSLFAFNKNLLNIFIKYE